MKIQTLLLMITPSLFAQTLPPSSTVTPAPTMGYIIHASTDARGIYTEELVRIPEGATIAEYAAVAIPVANTPVSTQPKGLISLAPASNGAALVYTLEFSEFRELLPMPRWTEPVVAQNGGQEVMPEQKPGILSRSLQVAKENPWKTGIATFLLADYATGNGIDAFGVFADGDNGSGRPTVNVSGENNTVTITDNANSGNDQSNRPSTAAPFFPPQTGE